MNAPLAAIVGIGHSPIARVSDLSPLTMAIRSITAAVEDAGLTREDIDGLINNVGSPSGVDYDVICDRLNLSVRWANQTWAHGRWVASSIQEAVMVVGSGLADYVAVVRAARTSHRMFGGRDDKEGGRDGGGPHGELPHYGLTAPASGAAMALRRYLDMYRASLEQLGHVAVALRANAALNPNAVFRDAITFEDYAASPMLIEPMRRLDFSISADGGTCLIVTTPERAASTRSPVYITGMQGIQAGREEFVFGRPGLGLQQQQVDREYTPLPRDAKARERAGVGVEDVDAFYCYDAFSPLIWFALERHGFCGAGEAPAFCADGRIGLTGALPINTNGGMLSEGHLSGYTHMLEMVRQLRGEAGERQLSGARVLQWGSCFGDGLVMNAAT